MAIACEGIRVTPILIVCGRLSPMKKPVCCRDGQYAVIGEMTTHGKEFELFGFDVMKLVDAACDVPDDTS
jgi:hypothetical protein